MVVRENAVDDVFKDDPSKDAIYTRIGKIDPAHQLQYDEYRTK